MGVLQQFELASFDFLISLQADSGPDPRLLVVGITEADLEQYGWPLADQVVADVLKTLQEHQPQVVGLDLYRNTPQPPGKAALEQQFQADNVITIMNVGETRPGGDVPAPTGVPWERIGFNDLVIDPDGVMRRSLLFVRTSERAYYSFALRLLLAAGGDRGVEFRDSPTALSLNGIPLHRLRNWSGGYQTIDARGYQIVTHYRSRHSPAQQLSIHQILTGQFDPALIQNRIVLIGTTAPSLKDEFLTPYSDSFKADFTQSGVVVHAQILSQLLDIAEGDRLLYRFLPWSGELLWLLGWAAIAGGVAWKTKHPLVLLCISAGSVAVLWGIAWVGLSQLIWLPSVEVLAGFLLSGGLVVMQKALYQSTHDWLTNLPGREVFIEHTQRALQGSGPVFVAFLDINRFKLINQSLGHVTGDQVLITMAKRLRQILPEGTYVARVGGDEFALLFQNKTQEMVEQSLKDLQTALSEPFHLHKNRLSVTASVGLAIAQNGVQQEAVDLLRDAHTAMYQAKALDEFSHLVFSSGMREDAINRLQLESHLLDALEKQEFTLYYQPIISLETGELAGFEALVRWQQKERGFVPPGAFIPVVEETGLIIPLGQWIFQEACRQLKTWQEQFPDYCLKMSINLSRRQFIQTDLIQQIERTLEETGVDGHRIQLEITESMVMRDAEDSRQLMLRLKELGLQLAIDDFGTGYSSLSYLLRFPTDTLKVDRSFIGLMEQDSEDLAIVRTIITLGHTLNMTLVAEGVETAGQVALLKSADCQYGQGYFFSRPLSPEDATQLLKNSITWPVDEKE